MFVSCISVYSNILCTNSLIFNVVISAYFYIPMVVLCIKMSKYSNQFSIDLNVPNLWNIWMLQKKVAFTSLFSMVVTVRHANVPRFPTFVIPSDIFAVLKMVYDF